MLTTITESHSLSATLAPIVHFVPDLEVLRPLDFHLLRMGRSLHGPAQTTIAIFLLVGSDWWVYMGVVVWC